MKPWICLDCRILMVMDPTGDFCHCPNCGTEVWFKYNPPPSDPLTKFMRLGQRNHIPREQLPQGEPTPGGGSKSRNKKPKNKKPSTTMLDNKLFIT